MEESIISLSIEKGQIHLDRQIVSTLQCITKILTEDLSGIRVKTSLGNWL